VSKSGIHAKVIESDSEMEDEEETAKAKKPQTLKQKLLAKIPKTAKKIKK
jgi:hypothetical protein